ncbi:beta-1, partial [Colletotrichum scovillei]
MKKLPWIWGKVRCIHGLEALGVQVVAQARAAADGALVVMDLENELVGVALEVRQLERAVTGRQRRAAEDGCDGSVVVETREEDEKARVGAVDGVGAVLD